MKPKLLLFCAHLLFLTGLTADPLLFDRLGPEDGLSNGSVSSIVQDKLGYLWFGTQGGLNRWDGYSFKVWDNDPYDANTLSHSLVQSLYLDPDGVTLWVGTYRGLNRFDTSTGKITRFLNDDADPTSLSHNIVTAIFRDQANQLWVGTLGGLNRLRSDGKAFDRFVPNPGDSTSLGNGIIRSFYQDGQGRLWIGHGAGLDQFLPDQGHFRHALPKPGVTVMAIFPGQVGHLWLAAWGEGLVDYQPDTGALVTHSLPDNRIYTCKTGLGNQILAGTWGGGLTLFNPQTLEVQTYRHDGRQPTSLAHDIVYSLLEDRTGLLWIGTNGNGVSKYNPRRHDFTYLTNNPEAPLHLPFGKVSTLAEDHAGNLWIGVQGGGLSRLAAGEKTLTTWSAGSPGVKLSDNNINFIFEDSQRRLWIGTNKGLNRFDPARQDFQVFTPKTHPELGFDDEAFYSMTEDSQGRLWIGTYRAGFDVFTADLKPLAHYRKEAGRPASLSDNMIYKFLEDSQGGMWVATNHGVNYLPPHSDRFQHFTNNPDDRDSLSSDTVRDLHLDSVGRLWVATAAGGLNVLDPKTNKFSHFTQKNGLPSNTVLSILEDKSGRLFFGTQNGLAVLDMGSTEFRVYGLEDGLNTKEFTAGHLLRRDGSVLMGSLHGIQNFNFSSLTYNQLPPPVRLTDFLVFNQSKSLKAPLDYTSSVELGPQENYFAITYAALDFTQPGQNHYAYKLEGFDKDWIQAGTRRFASYTNLPGGTYRFLVRGTNSDRVWGTQSGGLEIHIQPLFWDTLYFRIGGIGLLLALVGGFFLYRLQEVRKLNIQLELKVVERTRQIELANQELQKLNTTKDKFLSIIAHDLKNPFTGLLGLAEYLSEGTSSLEEMTAYTREIHKSLQGYYGLLENLLHWTRLQTGGVEVQPRVLVLRLEVERIFSLLLPTAHNKGLELLNGVDEVIFVKADPDLLASLLQNLVFNAIKFTPRQGKVTISAHKDEAASLAVITVVDTGIGMSPEVLTRLFQPDHKISTPGTEKEKGTGLGLMICKELVTKMGGTIEVTSQPGQGSQFTFTVPLGTAND